jgi:predicted P-loop ATPase
MPQCTHLTSLEFGSPAPCGKSFRLDYAGTLIKYVPYTGCSSEGISRGSAKRFSYSRAQEFAEWITAFTSSEILCCGTIKKKGDEFRVLARKLVDDQPKSYQKELISRTKDCIDYVSGTSGPMLLDTDAGYLDLNEAGRAVKDRIVREHGSLSPEALWAVFTSVCPGLKDTPHVWRTSTTSSVRNKHTGQVYAKDGCHIYLTHVGDGGDVKRAMETLHAHLVLAGYGYPRIRSNGVTDVLSLVDAVVFGGERECFEGAPTVHHPDLEVIDRPARWDEGSGQLLDTRIAIPDLTPEEKKQHKAICAKLRKSVADEAAQVKARWLQRTAAKIREHNPNIPEEAIQTAVDGLIGNAVDRDIYPDTVVRLANGTEIRGDELHKHIGAACDDPGEPYRPDCAKITRARSKDERAGEDFGDDPVSGAGTGDIMVVSMAHGTVRRYFLRPYPTQTSEDAGETEIEEGLKPDEDGERHARLDAEESQKNAWREGLRLDTRNQPKPHVHNLEIIMASHPLWRGVLAYDELRQNIVFVREPPYPTKRRVPYPLSDADCIAAQAWFNSIEIDAPKNTVADAMLLAAKRNSYHPVKDYLSSLRWDGTERLYTWLHDTVGADDNGLNASIGAKWLISCVARVMDPGAKVDTMLLLRGDQGLGKTSVFATLGGEWFDGHLGDVRNKDTLVAMQGKWIIEAAEITPLLAVDNDHVKSFLTRNVDHFRPPYGRVTEAFPRQVVFCGTLNRGASPLRDETGNRRFWCIECGIKWPEGKGPRADIDSLKAVRDQLWAEAVVRYHASAGKDYRWWLDPDEEIIAGQGADEWMDSDTWHDAIHNYVRDKSRITIADVLRGAIHLEVRDMDQRARNRAGKVLRALKWSGSKTIHHGGKFFRGYEAPAGWITESHSGTVIDIHTRQAIDDFPEDDAAPTTASDVILLAS